jgi:glycosyltransferase involved in cell wall biosynthesis
MTHATLTPPSKTDWRSHRPLRVAHVVPALFGDDGVVGGAERYVFELARAMADVTPTTLVTFGSNDRSEQVGPLRVEVLGRPWRVRGQQANPFTPRLFRRLAWADVAHCHQLRLVASSAAALFCRLTGRRVFVSDLGGGGWDVSGYVSTDRWYHGHLHISEYSRRISGHEAKPWGRVILGGVDVERFSPDARLQRDGTVVYAGRLLPHKGVNNLVEAVPADVPLEVIGRPYSPQFFADLTALAAGKRVCFRTDCDDGQLIDAYRRALCVVLPSVYRDRYGGETRVPELLGQTLLEGMACGAPAICTDVASMPEVVEDGVSGFVVPPNDPAALRQKLLWLLKHPERAREMGEAARRRVLDRFTWPAVVRRCLEAYGV